MAKTTAPLLSFGASGQMGTSIVYSKWKGVPTARRYTTPANPNSTEQQKTRGTFSYLMAVYKLLPAIAQAPWDAYISGKPLMNRNAFSMFNIPPLRGAADNSGFIGSPGNGGAIAPTTFAVADAGGGTHHASVTMGAPAVPAGWTITDSVAMALKTEASDTGTDYGSVAAASGDDSGNVTLSTGAGNWTVSGWFKFQKPDGSIAYGPSKTATVTVA